MAKRTDWDKIRRQSKVWENSDYDARNRKKKNKFLNKIARHKKAQRRFQKSKHLSYQLQKNTFHLKQPKISSKPIPPIVYRLLTITAPHFTACASFKRINGVWKVVEASPVIEWMKRVTHVDSIKNWLLIQKYSFKWGQEQSRCPEIAGQIPSNPAVAIPAEAYPPNKASQSSDSNSEVTLNQQTGSAYIPGSSIPTNEPGPAGAEWLNQSSPLNCSGCPEYANNAAYL